MYSLSYFCHNLITLEFSGQIFEKFQISNFMKFRLVGAALFSPDRRKDRYDEAISCFLRLCGRALAEVAMCNWNAAVQLSTCVLDRTVERVPTPHTCP